jgi:choline kinase
MSTLEGELKVIIVAAGQGTRLHPLTEKKPKCLVELNSVPLLDYQLTTYKKCGIDDINIVGGHCSEKLQNYSVNLFVNENYEKTNMVHSLFTAESIMDPGQDLIIAYGDIIFSENNLRKLIGSKASVAVVVDVDWKQYWSSRMENPLDDAETLKLNKSNHIIEIGTPTNNYNDIHAQYIGLIKIRSDKIEDFKEIWKTLNDDKKENMDLIPDNMYMTDFLQHLINSQWKVEAVEISAGWAEIDTQTDLDVALVNYNR